MTPNPETMKFVANKLLYPGKSIDFPDESGAGPSPLARELFLRFVEQLAGHKNSPALVFVTHHVEEIMPVFSHLLLLKDGGMLASDEKADALTSRNLSRAFAARMIPGST